MWLIFNVINSFFIIFCIVQIFTVSFYLQSGGPGKASSILGKIILLNYSKQVTFSALKIYILYSLNPLNIQVLKIAVWGKFILVITRKWAYKLLASKLMNIECENKLSSWFHARDKNKINQSNYLLLSRTL